MRVDDWKLRGHIVTSGKDLGRGWVTGRHGALTGAGAGEGPPSPTAVDLGARLLVPGFVDVHVHGAGGHQFAGDTPEEVAAEAHLVARHHAMHGTTTMLATTVTETPQRLRTIVEGLGRVIGAAPGEAAVAGTHLEGPWLSPARRGAHRQALLRAPDPVELMELVAASGDTIRLVTYAPELEGAERLLRAGLDAGIVMSVGHTDADHDTVRDAFDVGAAHVTHLGNAMPPLDRRAPGPLAAALSAEGVTVEVIADGIHVHPGLLALVGRVAGDRMVAVTDAVAACGMPAGRYRLGETEITVDHGRVTLTDRPGTLAGSGLTMDRAVATLVQAGVDLSIAVMAATATPAGVIGARSKGHLHEGADADVVVLDAELRAEATMVRGSVVWDPSGLLSALPDDPD